MSRMWPHHDRDDLLCVAIVMEKVESSRSKVHCFRGANDGSWPARLSGHRQLRGNGIQWQLRVAARTPAITCSYRLAFGPLRSAFGD